MIKNKISSITFSALFTAVIAVLSQVSFITPTVPITLQLLGVALCGYTLSVKWSLGCIVTYLAIGSLGIPIFSSFQGGIHIILGPTGGFLLGFIPLILCCSIAVNQKSSLFKFTISSFGLIICHIFGILQYSIVTGNSILISWLTASLPFIIKDVILLFFAYFMSKFFIKHIKGFRN